MGGDPHPRRCAAPIARNHVLGVRTQVARCLQRMTKRLQAPCQSAGCRVLLADDVRHASHAVRQVVERLLEVLERDRQLGVGRLITRCSAHGRGGAREALGRRCEGPGGASRGVRSTRGCRGAFALWLPASPEHSAIVGHRYGSDHGDRSPSEPEPMLMGWLQAARRSATKTVG
jgi:hypothetical protein